MPGRFFFKVCGLEGPIMTGPVILNTFMFDLLSCSVRITPLAWGPLKPFFSLCPSIRITPARAGTTLNPQY